MVHQLHDRESPNWRTRWPRNASRRILATQPQDGCPRGLERPPVPQNGLLSKYHYAWTRTMSHPDVSSWSANRFRSIGVWVASWSSCCKRSRCWLARIGCWGSGSGWMWWALLQSCRNHESGFRIGQGKKSQFLLLFILEYKNFYLEVVVH